MHSTFIPGNRLKRPTTFYVLVEMEAPSFARPNARSALAGGLIRPETAPGEFGSPVLTRKELFHTAECCGQVQGANALPRRAARARTEMRIRGCRRRRRAGAENPGQRGQLVIISLAGDFGGSLMGTGDLGDGRPDPPQGLGFFAAKLTTVRLSLKTAASGPQRARQPLARAARRRVHKRIRSSASSSSTITATAASHETSGCGCSSR